jgi:hypothetical protein
MELLSGCEKGPINGVNEIISYRLNHTARVLLLCLVVSTGVWGCATTDKKTTQQAAIKVMAPPGIPDHPPPLSAEEKDPHYKAKAKKAELAENAMNPEDLDPYHPQTELLNQAVQAAIHKKVFPVDMTLEKIGLNRPITREELAVWLGHFQQDSMPSYTAGYFEDVPSSNVNAGWTQLAVQKGWMPGYLNEGRKQFHPKEFVSRLAFCKFYAMMTGQAQKARQLSTVDLDQVVPRPETTSSIAVSAFSTATLDRFRNIDTISEQDKPFVAMTYQDHVLFKVFNLSVQELLSGKGFVFDAPVTRREGLVFLLKYRLSESERRRFEQEKNLPANTLLAPADNTKASTPASSIPSKSGPSENPVGGNGGVEDLKMPSEYFVEPSPESSP